MMSMEPPESNKCPKCGGQMYVEEIYARNRNGSVWREKCMSCGFERTAKSDS